MCSCHMMDGQMDGCTIGMVRDCHKLAEISKASTTITNKHEQLSTKIAQQQKQHQQQVHFNCFSFAQNVAMLF